MKGTAMDRSHGLYTRSTFRTVAVGALIALIVMAAAAAASVAQGKPGSKSAAPVGRYRVSLQGIRVTSQTWDNVLQSDGKGDEVFVSAKIAYLGKDGKTLAPETQLTSATMGDTNGFEGRRVQAGTASDRGGIVSGNTIPTSLNLGAQPVASSDLVPPAVLWEGDLVRNERAVVVTPAIWEWDGSGDTFGGWIRWLETAIPKVATAVTTFIGSGNTSDMVKKASDLGVEVLKVFDAPDVFGSAGDRPIGTVKASGGTGFVFDPQVVLLSYDRAEALIRQQVEGVSGLFTVRYKDDASLTGDYLLYLRVERVAQPRDTTAPRVTLLGANRLKGHRIRIRWGADDPYVEGAETTGVESFDVAIKKPRGWTTILGHTDSTSYALRGKKGQRFLYRVRARDGARNTSSWSQPRGVVIP